MKITRSASERGNWITRLALLVLICAGCTAQEQDTDNNMISDQQPLAAFAIPTRFSPEPGDQRGNRLIVRALEFSFVATQDHLSKAVPEFEKNLYGITHDTMVIVRPHRKVAPAVASMAEQSRIARSSIWNRTGRYSKACLGEERDRYTGMHRYYTYCDPIPSKTSPVLLMDTWPNPSVPPPADDKYIRATCNFITDLVDGEQAGKQHCKFTAYTVFGDQFTFRLTGKNLQTWIDVENHISDLLSSWRDDALTLVD